MKAAASVSVRRKVWARKMAQKVIISHIQIYLGSILWESLPISNPEYPCLPLPTYKDYEHLLAELESSGELEYISELFEGLVLVPILNTRIIKKNGELFEERRPEDIGKQDVPRIAYLVVKKTDLLNNRRYKCKKDFLKFITEIRAHSLKILAKEYLDQQVKKKVIESQGMREYWLKAGYSMKEIRRFIGKNKKETKVGRPAKPTPISVITKSYFSNKKENFDKTLERLRKMKIAL